MEAMRRDRDKDVPADTVECTVRLRLDLYKSQRIRIGGV